MDGQSTIKEIADKHLGAGGGRTGEQVDGAGSVDAGRSGIAPPAKTTFDEGGASDGEAGGGNDEEVSRSNEGDGNADGKSGEGSEGSGDQSQDGKKDDGSGTVSDEKKEPIRASIKDCQVQLTENEEGPVEYSEGDRVAVWAKGQPIILDVIEKGDEYSVGVNQSDSDFIRTNCRLVPGDRMKFMPINVISREQQV